MRQGYKPDGWLGFMIGSRIYIDFGRFDFETACGKLMTELSHQRKQPLPSKAAKIIQHELPTKPISDNQQTHAPPREKSLVNSDTRAFSVYTRRKPTSNFIRKPLNQWTESDVLDFLFTQRLIELMPLCETMDGRALIQLYKMCVSQSSNTYALLNDELKSRYKMKLRFEIYIRFLSAMEQRLTARPPAPVQKRSQLPITTVTSFPQEYVSYPSTKSIAYNVPLECPSTKSIVYNVPLEYPSRKSLAHNVPLEYPSRKSLAYNVPLKYPSHSDKPYDLLITSNAPALDILRSIERYGLNFVKMSSIQTQNPVRF
jgi:hypothetical protein